MQYYITHYTIPVAVVLVVVLTLARLYHGGKKFKAIALVVFGFFLGWASAYISLGIFHLYK